MPVKSAGQWGVLTLLAISGALYICQLSWGLPNANVSWAVDAMAPLTPLAVAESSFAEGWNSGWFYYKYPIGHALLLLMAYVPYLGALWISGEVIR